MEGTVGKKLSIFFNMNLKIPNLSKAENTGNLPASPRSI